MQTSVFFVFPLFLEKKDVGVARELYFKYLLFPLVSTFPIFLLYTLHSPGLEFWRFFPFLVSSKLLQG